MSRDNHFPGKTTSRTDAKVKRAAKRRLSKARRRMKEPSEARGHKAIFWNL